MELDLMQKDLILTLKEIILMLKDLTQKLMNMLLMQKVNLLQL
jgi:hypothetical protein